MLYQLAVVAGALLSLCGQCAAVAASNGKVTVQFKPTMAGSDVELQCPGSNVTADGTFYLWTLPGGGVISTNQAASVKLDGHTYEVQNDRTLVIKEITGAQVGTYKCVKVVSGKVEPPSKGHVYKIPYAVTPKNYLQSLWIAILVTGAFAAVCALAMIVAYFDYGHRNKAETTDGEVNVFEVTQAKAPSQSSSQHNEPAARASHGGDEMEMQAKQQVQAAWQPPPQYEPRQSAANGADVTHVDVEPAGGHRSSRF